MEEKERFYYFYKIMNNINLKYYYGVHQTDNLNDGYMGSGIRLQSAFNKYGKENFTKTILKYFNSAEEMYDYEKSIVTKDLVLDSDCYNLTTGGKGSGSFEYCKNMSNTLKKRYSGKEGSITKNKISNSLKEFWKTEKGKDVISKQVEKRKTFFETKEGKKKISDGLKNFYKSNKGIIEKQNKSKKSKDFWNNNLEKKEEFRERFSGFNNPYFIKNRKPYFDKIKDDFLFLSLKTDMSYSKIIYFISNKYGESFKINNIINYYQYCGHLKNVVDRDYYYRFISFRSKQKLCRIIFENTDINPIRIFYYIPKYFDNLESYMNDLYNMNYSDSYINRKNNMNLKDVLLDIGIIKVIEKKRINIRETFPNSQRATGMKTIYGINEKFDDSKIKILGDNLDDEYKIFVDGNSIRFARI